MYIAFISICFVVFLWGMLYEVKLIKTGENICKQGIHGKGIIKNYDRIHSLRYHIFFPSYSAVVEFYIDTQRYTIPAIGIFHKRQWRVGEEVEILYWDKCDEYIVIKDYDFKKSYVFCIVSYSILEAIVIVSLLISYI